MSGGRQAARVADENAGSSEGGVGFESRAWGMSQIQAIDLAVLADLTGMPREECLARLSSYTPSEMGDAWRNADPRTPEEIRRFYAETDLYIWELLAWQGSAAYEPSRQQLERLMKRWPPRTHPRALDYGCGVGGASLLLAQSGYRVTIAEVPGRTLDFARARLARHGRDVDVIKIEETVRRLPEASWAGSRPVSISKTTATRTTSPAEGRDTAARGGRCI